MFFKSISIIESGGLPETHCHPLGNSTGLVSAVKGFCITNMLAQRGLVWHAGSQSSYLSLNITAPAVVSACINGLVVGVITDMRHGPSPGCLLFLFLYLYFFVSAMTAAAQ